MAFKKIEPKMNFPLKQVIKGDWKCSECGTGINELPFDPVADRPIYCRECLSKNRAERVKQ